MAEYGKPTPKPLRKSGTNELLKNLMSSWKSLRDRLGKHGLLKSALILGAITSGFIYWNSSSNEIQGTFTLNDLNVKNNLISCKGTGGYSDIQAGVSVVVKNQKNEIIAKSELEDNISSFREGKCIYPFKVVNIPKSSFYIIEVGKRGALTYSRKELAEQDWQVHFTLGR